MLLAVLCCAIALAQAPTGTITGTLTDESGAVIPNATITITNKATGVVARTATTDSQGYYSAPALPAGDYEVRAEVSGFRTVQREATVFAGGTITVNMPMTLGATKEVVTVEAASAQINYESHNIQGVIERSTIQDLPLNGRSYLQLAQLEPGVQVSSGTVAQFNVLFTINVLGGGNRTAVTIDGGNVSDNIDVGGGMSSMNFSQETVQEFQLSEVNFDISTPIAAGGAINVVTRSGSNDWHGSGYFFFRDHNMAAYPNLKRLPGITDPFFVRRNPGFSFSGPIKKDKLFFFFNYEFLNQVQAISIQTTDPAFQALQNTYGSPYSSKQLSLRLDDHLTAKHNLFLRYSHDGNSGFGQSLEFGDPSNWPHNTNWADQSIIGLTSSLTPTIVNDIRFQYNYWNNHNNQAVAADCGGPCVAGSLPNVFTFVGGNMPAVGPNFNAPQARNTRRFELVEALSWQKGSHRFKFGGDLNPTKSAGLWGFCTPLCAGAFSPTYLTGLFGAAAPAIFPAAFKGIKTDADVLNLPVLNLGASIFSGTGVGVVSLPGAYDYDQNKHYDQWRMYFQDVWKIRSNFTVNYGLAWNAQTGFYNSDLPKPALLSPILGTGSDNLGPTVNNLKEFQPALGFAWSPGKSQKWVIRGGAGIYWDSTPGYYKLREASVVGPPGSARSTLAASAFTNNIAGPFGGSGVLVIGGSTSTCPIPGLPCSVLPIGAPLPLGGLTTMTVGQYTNLVAQELPGIAAILAPPNPPRSGAFPAPNLNYAKQGVELYPTHFPLARSYQTSLGIQHDLGHGMVVTADWARRQGENVSLSEVDWNLFNRYLGTPTPAPVIPLCTKSPDFDPTHACSTGGITFWTDQGRAVYDGLLVKLSKRFSNRYQFLASYAFQKGLNETVVDDANYMKGYGEYLPHHQLQVSGTVDMPWGFVLSLNSSIISRTPQTASVNGLFLPGTVPHQSVTGTITTPLPGLGYGCLAAGCSKADLQKAVDAYNANVVGTKDAKGSVISAPLALPSDYQFGDPTITQDFRLTKTFTFKERYRVSILGELFNAFNIANLTYPASAFILDNKGATPAFGQPTQRVNQTFGSAGPRALQVGARFTF
jgi:hypothetical protein